jgi:uncharacterized Zn finger protein
VQTPIPNLSEDLLRREASEQSYERGQEYYLAGAVWDVIRRGDKIVAQVEGSQYEPYTVSIDVVQDGIVDATCDCPYDWGGWCKHIVATLLVCLHKPEQVESKPSIGELLSGLDVDQLRALLTRLAEDDARLIDPIEQEVALLVSGAATSTPGRATIDQASIRRQVSAILHSLDHMRRSEAYWHVASVVDRVRQLLARVQNWIETGDTANAFAFLEAITDAYVEDWAILDDSDGDPSGFFADLGDAWEAAALAADLSPAEGEQWTQKLAQWQEQLSDYELDDALELARMAIAEQR